MEEIDESTAVFIACGNAFCATDLELLAACVHTKMDYEVNIDIDLGFRCNRRGNAQWRVSSYVHGEPTP